MFTTCTATGRGCSPLTYRLLDADQMEAVTVNKELATASNPGYKLNDWFRAQLKWWLALYGIDITLVAYTASTLQLVPETIGEHRRFRAVRCWLARYVNGYYYVSRNQDGKLQKHLIQSRTNCCATSRQALDIFNRWICFRMALLLIKMMIARCALSHAPEHDEDSKRRLRWRTRCATPPPSK